MRYTIANDELYHFGVKGMRWGIRRYQNPDGTLTAAGRKHQYKEIYKSRQRELNKRSGEIYKKHLDTVRAINQEVGTQKNNSKRLYEEGKIDKDTYKGLKRSLNGIGYKGANASEYKMAVAQYKVQKLQQANRLIYIKNIKGEQSKKYKRALKYYNSNSAAWQNYIVTKNSDGSYKVLKINYY